MWQPQKPMELRDYNGTLQIVDPNQPTAPATAMRTGPDQEIHWGLCTHGPCKAHEGGGCWFLVEDGAMYAWHKPHLPESDVAECEALRTVYAEKYISA